MITSDAVDETLDALGSLTQALGGTLNPNAGLSAAALKYALDDLVANADELLRTNTIVAAITNAFALSVPAGATIATLEAVRSTMLALSKKPDGTPAALYDCTILVIASAVWACLACESQVYSNTTFTSRQQVDAALDQIGIAFDAGEVYAADNGYSQVYQLLIKAHADIVTHLSSTARPLPKLINYSVAEPMTSIGLSQFLYGDLNHADDLVAENGSYHPAFMAITGRALSA